jgi:hypothetical protein
MSDSIRHSLAAAQSDLVRALTSGGPIPNGFEESPVRIMAATLLHKRSRTIARVWPALAVALGDAFTGEFHRYAAAHSLPADADAIADGLQFMRFLQRSGNLPDEARLERLGHCLHTKRLAVTRLKQSRRTAIGIRLPWLGVRLILIPF